MKKLFIICMLVITGITGNLYAQVSQVSIFPHRSKTDLLFTVSGIMPHRFIVQLKNGNSVTIQLADRKQFDLLSNLDSILKKVAEDIRPLKDSLSDELTTKRVDHLTDGVGRIKIRYIESPPSGNSYVQLKDELTPMKVEQDSLYIVGYHQRPGADKPMAVPNWAAYRILVQINNINDLESLIDGTLNTAMNDIKAQWDKNKKWNQKAVKFELYAFYYAPDPTKNRPLRDIVGGQKKYTFAPYVQAGLQNVNNLMTTSIGAGVELSKGMRFGYRMNFQLFWEPYFFFDRRTDGHFKMRRNDFITFQVTQEGINTTRNNGVEFHSNLSIGYLIHGSGNYFYDHTIKFGLPGAKYKFVHLHPEFIFNDLFKNFQPGLKLMLDLD